jgi:hypothetical protein
MSQTNSIHANNYILKDSDSETVFQYNIVSITGDIPESNGVITISHDEIKIEFKPYYKVRTDGGIPQCSVNISYNMVRLVPLYIRFDNGEIAAEKFRYNFILNEPDYVFEAGEYYQEIEPKTRPISEGKIVVNGKIIIERVWDMFVTNQFMFKKMYKDQIERLKGNLLKGEISIMKELHNLDRQRIGDLEQKVTNNETKIDRIKHMEGTFNMRLEEFIENTIQKDRKIENEIEVLKKNFAERKDEVDQKIENIKDQMKINLLKLMKTYYTQIDKFMTGMMSDNNNIHFDKFDKIIKTSDNPNDAVYTDEEIVDFVEAKKEYEENAQTILIKTLSNSGLMMVNAMQPPEEDLDENYQHDNKNKELQREKEKNIETYLNTFLNGIFYRESRTGQIKPLSKLENYTKEEKRPQGEKEDAINVITTGLDFIQTNKHIKKMLENEKNEELRQATMVSPTNISGKGFFNDEDPLQPPLLNLDSLKKYSVSSKKTDKEKKENDDVVYKNPLKF